MFKFNERQPLKVFFLKPYFVGSVVSKFFFILMNCLQYLFYVCIYVCVCVYIYMYVCVYIFICVYICVYVCVYIYIYMCVYIYMYIYILAVSGHALLWLSLFKWKKKKKIHVLNMFNFPILG